MRSPDQMQVAPVTLHEHRGDNGVMLSMECPTAGTEDGETRDLKHQTSSVYTSLRVLNVCRWRP